MNYSNIQYKLTKYHYTISNSLYSSIFIIIAYVTGIFIKFDFNLFVYKIKN